MTANPARVAEFLQHIIQAVSRISSYTSGMSEAARKIELADPDFAAKNPQLPLHDIYLMRNRLAHGYFSIDLALVWNSVRTEIPPLQLQIEAILNRP